jgi:beta-glucosidase-like glycosyl hydrolase
VTSPAALLVPALRWDATHGFEYLRDTIDDALETGVGGFLIRGGTRAAVAALAAELHRRSAVPLLLAADAERGAGQQFDGCIGLPPLAALASLNDPDAMRRAARTTARELKQLGLNWAFAPVCDLDVEPGSAIVGTRSAGGEAAKAAPLLAEWIDACQAEGVLACAKHFPGHGQAAEDSHRTLPVVHARAGQLWHDDILPFNAALDAGVASMMTAHVAYPSLDPTGVPATLSAPIVTDLLRREMQFSGLIVTDALDMDGLLAAGAEADVAVRAIAAGCDVLLAPADIGGTAGALERALKSGTLREERVRDAVERRDRWALWGRPMPTRESTLDDIMWSRQVADRGVQLIRGALPRLGGAAELIEIDDDTLGAWTTPSRAHFAAALRALEIDAPIVTQPSAHTRVPVLIAAYSDVVAWKGTAGFSAASVTRIEALVTAAKHAKRDSLVVLFSHPRHAAHLPSAPNVLCAWGGERPMQEAAARALTRRTAAAPVQPLRT